MKNILKEKLHRGETAVGVLVGLGHLDVTEWLSQMGYDWLFLDAEHGPMSYETLLLSTDEKVASPSLQWST